MTATDAKATIEIADRSRLPAEPLVSVYMLAYQHEKFIAQAIEGVIAQQCDFPIELIIGDDCSPDRTGEIARSYQQRYPHLIRILTARQNVGAHANAARCRRACRGQFIAICEGDDYWTAPDKLAKQASVLLEDGQASIAFHDVREIGEGGDPTNASKIERVTGRAALPLIDGKALIKGAFIPTVSILYRNYGHFPPEMPFPIINGDNYLIAHLGSRGHARLVTGTMAAYRHHPGGIWSARNAGSQRMEHIRSFLAIFQTIDKRFRKVAVTTLYNKVFIAILAFATQHGTVVMPKGFPRLAATAYLAPILYPFRAGFSYESLATLATALAYPVTKLANKLRPGGPR